MPKVVRDTPTEKLARITYDAVTRIEKHMVTKAHLADELHATSRDILAGVEALLDAQTQKLAQLIQLEQRVVRVEKKLGLPHHA